MVTNLRSLSKENISNVEVCAQDLIAFIIFDEHGHNVKVFSSEPSEFFTTNRGSGSQRNWKQYAVDAMCEAM